MVPEKVMEEGSIPLIHPENHLFRERDKSREKEPMGGVRVKTYPFHNEGS